MKVTLVQLDGRKVYKTNDSTSEITVDVKSRRKRAVTSFRPANLLQVPSALRDPW